MPDLPRISNAVKWTICAMASLGFLFDIYEVLVAPLVLQPAVMELGGFSPGTSDYRYWTGLLFWIPPLVGGFCGLWGGYLADRFGRRRILVWSILLYTVSAVSAGMSTRIETLLLFRALCFAGVCVEFIAAVAWLAELFPDPKIREAVLGYTQLFSSLGGAMVAGAFYLANRFGTDLPAIYGGHSAWRYTLISGLAPAIPLMLIRPFLPESPQWQQRRSEGTLKRPSVAELFRPEFRRSTVVTALLFACAYGAAFGTVQQSPQIAAGLPEVRQLPTSERGQATAGAQTMQELGGLAGRFAIASLGLLIVSRRALLRIFLLPGLFVTAIVFFYTGTTSLRTIPHRRVRGWVFHHRAAYIPGELHAAHLSAASARHRRRIRRERRRPDARDIGVFRHDTSRCRHAGRVAGRAASLRRGRCRNRCLSAGPGADVLAA